ncbi:uncharacterized protein LAESUDRAFT_757732 [Laetiporus sulphureus 93-53]|uniref:Mei2-like C-terminal RNA recognition motif domain-containing protein n=1 Tax=Laetiporus sulphureus 93-53 TaxID=1314785 RepID=A0A165F6M3_9APHY|nr:uncharacterized protein LAESUDRAFT_757732 [Laetiporus sulphureus 93-53]KZT08496.1 hypothetical protein LAESUDRAFT_757732 [Laetiporus sulphureus 93-53]
MDQTQAPVPFPTLTCPADEVETRPSLPSRVHSSPSLPDLWPLSQSRNGHAQRFQALYRPHLHPLDLAATPPTTPPRSTSNTVTHAHTVPVKRSTSGSPCRPAPLLTPPLTPSSSFQTHDGPVTPPEIGSPLRWVHAAPESPTALKGCGPLPTRGGYLTPSSGRSQSFSSDVDGEYVAVQEGADAVSVLISGLTSMDITPREERKVGSVGEPAFAANAKLGDEQDDADASRFLLVRDVPLNASSADLREAFAPTGDVKGIWVPFLESHGVIILAYYDIRHATRARSLIANQAIPGLEDAHLAAKYVSAEQIERVIGKSAFVDETDGTLYVSVADRRFQSAALQKVLASLGELMSYKAVDSQEQNFQVEYYDARDAANAYRAFHDRIFLGVRLRLLTKKDAQTMQSSPCFSLEDPFQPSSPASPTARRLPMLHVDTCQDLQQQADRELRCTEGRVRPRSVSASENMGAPDAVRRLWRGRESPQEHSRRVSNDLFFDAVGKGTVSPQTPSRPRSISMGPDDIAKAQRSSYDDAETSEVYQTQETAYPSSYGGSSTSAYAPQEYLYAQAVPQAQYPAYGSDGHAGTNGQWAFSAPAAPSVEYYLPPSPRVPHYHSQALPSTPKKGFSPMYQRRDERTEWAPTEEDPFGRSAYSPDAPVPQSAVSYGSSLEPSPTMDGRTYSGRRGNVDSGIAEKNQLNIEAIEQGKDMRTTVMIKNVPNKMSDKELKAFIDRVCPRRIDFLYLRMDFKNGCNVGYAFVNFITLGDLLHFAKTQIGVKWNIYSSDKDLRLCYATYQGKEALMEKFKNSCIMDEREAWRPKIYYSAGPNQGLPEPFPPPTHLRRKERSSHNRGALFVPGANFSHHRRGDRDGDRDGNGTPTLYHHRPHPPRMSNRM